MQKSENIDNTLSRRTAITPRDSAGCPSSSAPAVKPRIDLLCEHCQQAESTHLIYYRRYYQESGRYALINPLIVCDHCIELYRNSNLLFEHMPVIVPFAHITTWDHRLMGLTNKKRWEWSCFNTKYWRKKLNRIKFVWQNPPK